MLAENLNPAAQAGEDQASLAPEFAARAAHLTAAVAGVAAAPAESQASTECWSTSPERFEAESLSNLVIANDWLRAGDIVYVGTKRAVTLADLIDAQDIVLIMSERSTKLAGDAADGYPGVTEKQKRILEAALRGWIALCCPPDFLGVQNIRRYSITDLDLDVAARAVIGGAQ
jgi:hypothetical protein